MLALLEPFAQELAHGDDDRMAKHVNERIYQHLMRQSDLGIASEEALENGDHEEEGEEEEEDDDEDIIASDEGVKDPRAGSVSVNLPQLKPDFSKVANLLFKVGSEKNISSKRRTLLYDLTKQFKDLSEDVYPLLPDLSHEEAKIPKLKVGKEAQKRAKEELLAMEKIKEERENFKKSRKRKQSDQDLVEEAKKVKMADDDKGPDGITLADFDDETKNNEIEITKANGTTGENNDGKAKKTKLKKKQNRSKY